MRNLDKVLLAGDRDRRCSSLARPAFDWPKSTYACWYRITPRPGYDRSAAGALDQTQKSEAELVGPEIRAQFAHKIRAARPQ